MNDLTSQKIYVAGHRGMVGSAVVRALDSIGVSNIITRTRDDLDLVNQAAVESFFTNQQPDSVIFCAGKVGGILANSSYPAEFIYQNLVMAANSIHGAYLSNVNRFLFLGSTCIYPRNAPQPIPESCLLTGQLEATNEAYAIAKISGLKMCQHYRAQYGVTYHCAMPTNLYGPGDNYHPDHSHVMPALIRRFHEAKETNAPKVHIWGTGKPRREFLHVDDLANGLVHLLQLDQPPDLVNIGTGTDISISDLASLIAQTIGFQGEIAYETSKPDGTLLKRTDISEIQKTGWSPSILLKDGIVRTYQDFLRETNSSVLRSI